MTISKILLLMLIGVGLISAQTQVWQIDDTENKAYQKVIGYSGSNVIYICKAFSVNNSSARIAGTAVTSISKANPAILTSTADHGFPEGSSVTVTLSGITGTGWTTLNNVTLVGVWASTTTLSLYTTSGVAVDSTGFGTLGGTILLSSTGPRLGRAEWQVMRLSYDGGGNVIFTGWQNGSVGFNQKCSLAGTTGIAAQ